MKRKLLIIAVILLLIPFTVFGQIIDQTVATVRLTEVEAISQKKFKEQIQLLQQELRTNFSIEQRKQILENQINGILINQAAERDEISVNDSEIQQGISRQKAMIQQQLGTVVSDAQFRVIIENQAQMTWNEYLEQLKKRLLQEKYILEKKRSVFENIPQPTEKEIRDIYDQTAPRYTNPAMVRFSHIFIETRNLDQEAQEKAHERAESIHAKIRSGESSFEALVEESSDDIATRYKGGDFGWLLRTDSQRKQLFGDEFFKKVFNLPIGEISNVIESSAGFHIVKVTDRREPKLLKLDDPIMPGQKQTVRDQIKQLLLLQKQEELFQNALNDIVSELKKEADITIFEENLSW